VRADASGIGREGGCDDHHRQTCSGDPGREAPSCDWQTIGGPAQSDVDLWCVESGHGKSADLIGRISRGNSDRSIPAQTAQWESSVKAIDAQESVVADFTIKEAWRWPIFRIGSATSHLAPIRGILFAVFSACSFLVA
jgi:hypothetical protein